MANRFPLILDSDSQKVKELPADDNLDLTGNDITSVRNIIPEDNEVYNLGSPTKRWNELFLSGNTIDVDGSTISIVDGNFVFKDSGGNDANLSFGGNTTDDLAEGSANLYFTTQRIDDHLTGGTGITYDAGVISVSQDIGTGSNVQFNNLTLTGDLTVSGTTTTLNTTTLDVEDINITVANGAADSSAADGAGLTADLGSDGSATFTYDSANDRWTMNKSLDTDLIGNVTGTVSDISNHDTDDLTEGSSNLYYTDTRSRNALSASGDLSYDSATGEFSFTERTDAEVLGLFSGSTGIDYNSSTGSITLADTTVTAGTFGSASDVPVITIDDQGRITDASTTTVAGVSDFTYDNTTGVLDIDTADGSTFSATVELGPFTTDDLSEGTSSLYFTESRARDALSAGGDLSYDSATGTFSFTERTDSEVRGLLSASGDLSYDSATGEFSVTTYKSSDFDSDFSGKDTDDLSEGTTNLYYTDTRTRNAVSASGDLSYDSATGTFSFTERTDSEVRNLFSASGDLGYDSATGTFSVTTYKSSDFDTDFSGKDTDDLSEGTNLYYTDARVDSHLSGGTGVSYSSGTISIGQPVGTTDNVEFNDVVVAGDLTVSGTTTTVNTETLDIADNNITLNSNYSGSSPTENGGITVNRGTESEVVLQWNETNDHWEIESGGTTGRILTTGDVGSNNGLDADLLDGEQGSYYLNYNNFTNTPSNLSDFSNDENYIKLTDLSVSGDLSYDSATGTFSFTERTDSEVRGLFSASGDLSYDSSTGEFSVTVPAGYDSSDFNADFSNKDTDDLSEGTTNLYYTDARVDSRIGNGTLTVEGGSGLSGSGTFDANASSDNTITIDHGNTSSQDSVNNSGNTVIQSIDVDQFGHITSITSSTASGGATEGTAVTFDSIGVGTAAPSTSGELRATGDVIAHYSDDRLKTRLGTIDSALNKVSTLEGFYYEPNETAESYGYEKERRVGLSAQDVQEILPEVVRDAPIGDGYLTLQYEQLIPLLVEAIKELKTEVEDLRKKI